MVTLYFSPSLRIFVAGAPIGIMLSASLLLPKKRGRFMRQDVARVE
ncbi:MAG TPA: hypothetical protein VJ001_09110 [Rhodocyclaceae bacterium]|nr:hypothetical protein [Rhodocyclaceae bacterium]